MGFESVDCSNGKGALWLVTESKSMDKADPPILNLEFGFREVWNCEADDRLVVADGLGEAIMP